MYTGRLPTGYIPGCTYQGVYTGIYQGVHTRVHHIPGYTAGCTTYPGIRQGAPYPRGTYTAGCTIPERYIYSRVHLSPGWYTAGCTTYTRVVYGRVHLQTPLEKGGHEAHRALSSLGEKEAMRRIELSFLP